MALFDGVKKINFLIIKTERMLTLKLKKERFKNEENWYRGFGMIISSIRNYCSYGI